MSHPAHPARPEREHQKTEPVAPLESDGGGSEWLTDGGRGERERRLRTSEERLALVIEGTRDGIWDWDVEAGGIYYSPRWKEMIGYSTPEEQAAIPPVYASWAERTHPDDLPAAERAIRDHLEGRTPEYRAEFRFRHRDGTWRWMVSRGRALRHPDGRAYRFAGAQTDVTERKQAEEALRERQARFDAIFQGMFQFMGLLSPDGTLLEANRAALEFAGLGATDVVGRPFWEAPWWSLSEATRRRLRESVARAAEGEFVRYEAEVVGAGGRVLTIDFSLRPVLGDDGRVVYLIPEGRDISERLVLEAALRESESHLQRLIDASPDCIKTLSADGAMLDMNAGGRVAMEVDDFDALHGTPWPLLVTGEARPLAEEAVQSAAAGRTARFRAFCPTAKGSPRWWSVTVAPLPGPDGGGVRELLCISRDVTAEVEAEREREKRAERDRRIARTLQESLLPRITGPVGGVEAKAVHLPLSDEAEVGGDFYDVFPLAGGRTAVLVGDVMGKGLAAALSIAEVRFSLRGFLREQGPDGTDPADALSRLNRFLLEAQVLEERPRNALVALTLAVLDGASGAVALATAGSYPALVWRAATGEVEELEGGGGLILGVLSDAEYRSCRTELGPEDLLVLATDGVTEARNLARHALFGLEGLSAALREEGAPGRPLGHVGAAIVSRAAAFAGGRLQDDVCLLLARRGSRTP